MKKTLVGIFAFAALLLGSSPTASAQFDWGRALGGAVKALQAVTLSDKQVADYVRESVAYMDRENQVLPATDAYSVRLAGLTKGITQADGIPLNFKVYKTTEVNAFACPDGSVRVYTGLMDIMDDDELLGVIGHEIGHVMKHHSKNAMKNELLTGALKDAVASTSGVAARLTDSQLGQLGSTLVNARYSQKQEKEADDCGYDFLVANGRNPWGIVKSFEKLQAVEAQSGVQQGTLQKMFSSHPDIASRIERMTKRCQEDGYTRPVKTTPATKSKPAKSSKKTSRKSTAKFSKKK